MEQNALDWSQIPMAPWKAVWANVSCGFVVDQAVRDQGSQIKLL